MFVLKYIRYFLFAFGLSSAASAWSHPHAWIDVRSTVLTSDTGLVAAIKEEWLFDELYTSYVVEETTENTKEAADSAARFAGKAVENLKPFGYFMKIRSDGRQIPIGAITQYHSEMRGDRLLFQFTAPLTEPVDPKRHRFEFSVYDPTYFIEMTHDPKDPPRVQGQLAATCRLERRQTTPSVEAIRRAFAMDRGAAPDNTLGELFAEKVDMVCP